MFQRIIANLTVWLLKHKTLTGEAKMKVTNAMLNNIGALPIADVIEYKDGVMTVGGKNLDFEQANNLVSSAKALDDNLFRKVIQEQVKHEAIKMGIYNGLSPETILFAKAALWYLQEENKIIANILNE